MDNKRLTSLKDFQTPVKRDEKASENSTSPLKGAAFSSLRGVSASECHKRSKSPSYTDSSNLFTLDPSEVRQRLVTSPSEVLLPVSQYESESNNQRFRTRVELENDLAVANQRIRQMQNEIDALKR